MEVNMTLLLYVGFVFLALQIAVVVMLARAFTHRHTKAIGKMLHEQSDRHTTELQAAIARATAAAKEAYHEANTVNKKLEQLGLEQKQDRIEEKAEDKKDK